jgi:heme A synthase
MKHQLHRSITFWSGLLVMGFVCWAWRDSNRYCSRLSSKSTGLTLIEGAVYVVAQPNPVLGPEASRQFTPTTDRTLGSPALLWGQALPIPREFDGSVPPLVKWREQVEYRFRFQPTDAFVVILPLWLLLVGVFAIWLSLLLWRARRRKRAALTAC